MQNVLRGQYGTCAFTSSCAHSAPAPPNAVHGMIPTMSETLPRWHSGTGLTHAMCWSAGAASVPKRQQARVHSLPSQQAWMLYAYAGRGSRCCRARRGAGHVVCPRAAHVWTGTGKAALTHMPPLLSTPQHLIYPTAAGLATIRAADHGTHTHNTWSHPTCFMPAGDPGPHRRPAQGLPLLQSSVGRLAG